MPGKNLFYCGYFHEASGYTYLVILKYNINNKMEYNNPKILIDHELSESKTFKNYVKDEVDENINIEQFNNDSANALHKAQLNSGSRIIFEEDRLYSFKQNLDCTKYYSEETITGTNVNDEIDNYHKDSIKENVLSGIGNKAPDIMVPSKNINDDFEIKNELFDGDNLDLNQFQAKSRSRIFFKDDIEKLYEGHSTIKEELVIGPEIIQNSTITTTPILQDENIDNGLALTQTPKTLYECPHCCKSFVYKKTLDRHMIQAICVKQFICDYCDKDFIDKSQISQHIFKYHMKIEKKSYSKKRHKQKRKNYNLICDICSKKFCLKESFKQHLQSHRISHQISGKTCDICEKDFASVQNLNRHVQIVHEGIKPFSCKECGKTYRHRTDLVNHLQNVHNIVHKNPVHYTSYKCEFCNKKISDKSNYNRHLKLCRMNESRSTVQANNRDTKCKKTYKNQMKHMCNICQKRYAVKSSLDSHMKTHLGIEYQCDNCKKKFTRKHNLRVHIQSNHLNLRVYSCNKCKSTFKSRWGFLRHNSRQC